MKLVKYILVIALVVAGIVAILKWSADNDEKRSVAVEKYEQCVNERSGYSVGQYYELFGMYPVCE